MALPPGDQNLTTFEASAVNMSDGFTILGNIFNAGYAYDAVIYTGDQNTGLLAACSLFGWRYYLAGNPTTQNLHAFNFELSDYVFPELTGVFQFEVDF